MAGARRLRAVAEAEVAAAPLTVVEAAEQGDHRALLVAVRARLAMAVQDPRTTPRDLAALTRRLVDVASELRTLDAAAREAAGEGAVPDADFDASAV